MKSDPPVTPELVAEHGLTPREYERVQEILGREPSFTELGIFSVMWSEHCSYKSSKVHLRKFPTEGPAIVQGPGENAGIVDIGDGMVAVFKMESHNHPSFIEPYQGAATGVGGILRDIFTMGARCIASMDALRFGPLDQPRNRFLLDGVVAGIAGYGNCIGVPTVGGEIFFDECYNGNPLVNVFNLGIARKDHIFLGRAGGVGNPVIYAGSKTGRDGIHGATMASEEFDETSEERRPTVQVGDPFTEKLLMEACLELFKTDYVVGIQDMGAAGLTCSTCEMASRGDTGVEIDLGKVPQREAGMVPYELMLSESQERMLIVARKGTEDKVLDIFRKWDLEAEIIGVVTDDRKMRVRSGDRVVAEIPAHPLAEEGPVYERPMSRPDWMDEARRLDLSAVPVPGDLNGTLLSLLSSPGIARKQWVWEQYDHMVRINTVVLPGSDAAVIRVPGSARKGLALSTDCNPLYCWLDPREGAKAAVAESARNIVCSGGRPLAITNCLNFGNPEKPAIMWQFAQAVEGIAEACRAFGTPVTGGNVSFYNETLGVGVFPTPTIGMVGLLEDVSKHMTQWFKSPGDTVVLLGEAGEEVGGSEYLRLVHGLRKGLPPRVDLNREKSVQDLCLWAIESGLLSSAHDCSEGGIGVALAECCLSGPGLVGAEIRLEPASRPDALLFGESQGRIVVSLPEGKLESLQGEARARGVASAVIGKVGGPRLRVDGGGSLVDLSLDDMNHAWRETFAAHFRK